MRKISKIKNLSGLLDLASIPQYQNGGETVVERTLPEIEVYGDQLRKDLQRTGLTYDELSNLNYGAQRQSQIQGRKQPQEIEINPLTGNQATRHGDFLYDNITGQRIMSALPLETVSPEFDALTSLAGMRFVKNLVKPNRNIVRSAVASVDTPVNVVNSNMDDIRRAYLQKTLPDYATPNTIKQKAREITQTRLKNMRWDSNLPLDEDIRDIKNFGTTGLTGRIYNFYRDKHDNPIVGLLNAAVKTPFDRLAILAEPSPYFVVDDEIFKNTLGYNVYKFIEKLRKRPYFTYEKDDIDNIIAHEWQHVLDNIYGYHLRDLLVDGKIPGFDENSLEYFISNYGTELAARGTQLKNYFGIIDSYYQKITPEMLKYAKEFYVKDTGLDNNMTEFFEGITDYDEFAKWLSKAAYSKGGIHIKKKNRGKFTKSAKQHGMGVQEYARKVVNDPNATTLQKRRAQFAINAKKFKH